MGEGVIVGVVPPPFPLIFLNQGNGVNILNEKT
jgi:hypothetical protein